MACYILAQGYMHEHPHNGMHIPADGLKLFNEWLLTVMRLRKGSNIQKAKGRTLLVDVNTDLNNPLLNKT